MKILIHKLLPALTGIALLFLPACSKTVHFQEPPEVVNGCRIESFTAYTQDGESSSPSVSLSFTYNAAGNPLKIITSASVPNSQYDYHFRYDGFGRLTDFIINYPGEPGAVIWHRYSYPNRKTIVDTTYGYVGLIDGPPPTYSFDIYVDIYHLDDKDRIISDNDTHFQYDRNGNLVRSGVTYDNKVNLFRTNAVWLLINKDFSLNNPLNGIPNGPPPLLITGYNSERLPLGFILAPGSSFATSLSDRLLFFFTNLKIGYSCDSHNPHK